MALQIRRGSTAEREVVTFKEGEIVFDTTIKQVFIGDGTTLGGRPVTAYTDEDAITAIGDALVAGTHQNISFSYDTTGTDRINATVTLDGIGIEEVSDDISPELGGDLNLSTHDITGTGNINITGEITATSYNGVTAAMVGLGDVTNESKATMFTNPTFTGVITGDLDGDISSTGTSEFNNVNVSGLIKTTTSSDATTPYFLSTRTDDGIIAPALKLEVRANTDVAASGPELLMQVSTNSNNTPVEICKITGVRYSNAQGATINSSGAIRFNVWNGATSEQTRTLEIGPNVVTINNALSIYKNTITTSFQAAEDITETAINDLGVVDFDSQDINLFPESGYLYSYADFLPGSDSAGGEGYNLGGLDGSGAALRWTNLVINRTIASSVGEEGDIAGMVTVDDQYIYRCIADFDPVDPTADIWVRIPFITTPW